MTVPKYDAAMEHGLRIRLTAAQSNSLRAVADCMSLTVSDVIRAAVDQWIEDVPEPRLFTARVVFTRRRLPTLFHPR